MAYSYAWRSIFNPGKAADFFTEDNRMPFEAGNREFSRVNAWWLSELSRLIYLRESDSSDSEEQTATRNLFLNRMGLEEKWFYNGRFLQCAIIGTSASSRNSFTALVFRGTQGKVSNWFYNLNAKLSTWQAGGKVHTGFKTLLTQAWDEISEHLDQVTGPIYYTGHSLGGALAVLAASLREPEAVYTFGSPRIGNLEFVKSAQDINIYRIFTSNDIVAGITPFPAIMHVGEPYNLNCPRETTSQRSFFEAPEFLADHSPLNYTCQL